MVPPIYQFTCFYRNGAAPELQADLPQQALHGFLQLGAVEAVTHLGVGGPGAVLRRRSRPWPAGCSLPSARQLGKVLLAEAEAGHLAVAHAREPEAVNPPRPGVAW